VPLHNAPGQQSVSGRLAYYITPHGLGHAVRSLEVIRHLLAVAPGVEIVLVSALPQFIIRQNVPRPPPIRERHLDIGLVQRDSLRFDLEATRTALESLRQRQQTLVDEEIRFFRAEGIQGIVCDVPFLPFLAAARAGIPAVGIGNFTWDWIYQGYASEDRRWESLVTWIREAYRECPLFLQLPMHGDCSACGTIQPVPLVARQARRTREQTRRILGLAEHQKAYLVSFQSLNLDPGAERHLETMDERIFLHKHPLRLRAGNGLSLDDRDLSYADAVAAVDGVITKPGYGIVADCLVHGTPVIYTDRGLFPEYEILVRALTAHLTTVYIPSEALYAGRWQEAIESLEKLPRRVPSFPANGAELCARAIVDMLARRG
jgi:L-arabinokinase